MKRLLKIAIANDSLYLTKHSIIDYSMLVIINPEKKTVRIGIIDYIQQYTLEKELERPVYFVDVYKATLERPIDGE